MMDEETFTTETQRTTERPQRERLNRVTSAIIGAAIEVHKLLGPGLLESAYEECLCRELSLRGIPFERQLALPLTYLHLGGWHVGLLINFHEYALKDGIRRKVWGRLD
jgi:hypothetical protein